MAAKGLMSTYAPLPVTFEKGEGVWLYDTEGNKYLDALTGIAVCGLGHAHPDVARTIAEQAGRLIHTSNMYHIAHQETLGEKLTGISGMDACFFTNSGAEANECAIKLARLYGNKQDIDVPTIIVAEGAFHGRTMATLTATGSRKVRAGFEPLVQGFVRTPFNDLKAVETIAKNNNSVVAVMVEPVQGEGGVHVPDAFQVALRVGPVPQPCGLERSGSVDAGVVFSLRSGVLRFSFGLYNDESDVEAVLEGVRSWRASGAAVP